MSTRVTLLTDFGTADGYVGGPWRATRLMP